MVDKKCAEFLNDFILSTGKNTLLCESNLNSEKTQYFNCYNLKANTFCEYNMVNSLDYSKNWKKIMLDETKFTIFHNHIQEYKFTINVLKKV
jgi:hypothetical protein